MSYSLSRNDVGILRSLRLDILASVVVWSLCWVLLWFGASVLAVTFGISAWYPPAAISLYAMIRNGVPGAVGIFAAVFAVSFGGEGAAPTVHNVAAAIAHVSAYGAASIIYKRMAGTLAYTLRPASILALVVTAIIGATLASVLGNINHVIEFGGAHAFSFDNLFAWMIGDLFGVISICPVLLFLRHGVSLRGMSGARLMQLAKAPLAGLVLAIGLAGLFAIIAQGADVHFRLVTVVGVGVASVILSWRVAPRSALIYLFVIALCSAAWLSTEVAPDARVEFAVQIVTFLIASYAMMGVSMQRMRHRARALVRRLRLDDMARERDALARRIRVIEAEFAQLAHEFRTPVGGMIGMLSLAEDGLVPKPGGDLPAEQRAALDRMGLYFRHMRGCALYLNALVEDAFEAARLARRGIVPNIETVALGPVFDDLSLISETKTGGGVNFPECASIGDLLVRTDRNRLLQILINLLVNAVRYTDRPNSVTVGCAEAAQTVTVFVTNSARRVTKEDLDRRLRGEGALAEQSQGLGIGLPLVGRLSLALEALLTIEVAGGIVTFSMTLTKASSPFTQLQ